MNRKHLIFIPIIISVCCAICGCGKVKNAKSLIKQAERKYGKCEVISSTETEEGAEVVLRDSLQGFEYKAYSCMNDISIDGASFGSVPVDHDTFESALLAYVDTETESRVSEICEKYGVSMETHEYSTYHEILIGESTDEAGGIKAAEEIAAVFQEYNLDHRLDGFVLNLSHDDEWLHAYYEKLRVEHGDDIYSDPDYSYMLSSAGGSELCHVGSIKLPSLTYRNREKEQEDYYLEMAQMKNPGAVFVRSEEKTFADTGLPLDRVVSTLGQYYPEKMSDPVTFYYFSVKGKEFYICNFLDADLRTTTWYSNYDEIF